MADESTTGSNSTSKYSAERTELLYRTIKTVSI